MTEIPVKPVVVNSNPTQMFATSNLRVALVAPGAFATGRGWLSDNEVAQYIPVAVMVAPWAWGQYELFRTWVKTKVLARLLLDRIAVVK